MINKKGSVEPERPCRECGGTKQSFGHACYVCMKDKDWSKPFPLSKAEVVFPAGALHFMPKEDEIPKEFWPGRGTDTKESAFWMRFQSDWFFSGLKPSLQIDLKEGIDGPTAMAHLAAIQGTFACRHQHKQASVAYLCSLWFNSATWERCTSEELMAMKAELQEGSRAKEKDRAAAAAAGKNAVRPADGDAAGTTAASSTGAEGPATEGESRPAA